MKNLLYIIAISILIVSCNDNADPDENGHEGVMAYILSEGQFQNSNAEITGYDIGTGEEKPQFYQQVNESQLGDVGHSMAAIGDELYIVVNNSHRIQVTDANTLEQQASIEIDNEPSPRFIAGVSGDQALVTSLASTELAVIDTENHEQTGTIDIGTTSEEIAVDGDHALIRTDIFDSNEIILFNWQDESVEQTLQFDGAPAGMKTDSDNRAWIWVSGEEAYFSIREVTTGDELNRFELPEPVTSVSFDELGEQVFAATDSGILRMDKSTGAIDDELFVEQENLGSVGFDHTTRNHVFAGTEPDFETRDEVFVFDADGEIADTIQAGYRPHQFHVTE